MAKSNKAPQAQTEETIVNNLETSQEPTQEILIEGLTPDQVKAKIEEMKAEEKRLKSLLKGEKPKVAKETKGVMVTFTNKAGETITGKGVLYYVTRSGGKLHYKEATQVTILSPEEIEALPVNDITE